MTFDFAHTTTATKNRAAKAERLALAASRLGFTVHELAVKDSTHANEKRREQARKAAGVKSRASDETWTIALERLAAMAFEATSGIVCVKCQAPVRRVPTMGGALVEVDPFAHPMGTVWPRQHNGQIVAVVLAGHDTPPGDDTPLFRQHATSCAHGLKALERKWKEAPKCTACGKALSAELAYKDPTYRTHPCCYEE